jgi:hypothetical protein
LFVCPPLHILLSGAFCKTQLIMGLNLHFPVALLSLISASAVRVDLETSNKKEWPSCPYPYTYLNEDTTQMIGGDKPITCHKMSTGNGNTCPELQQARLISARRYQAANYNDFLERAQNFKLSPVFDKTDKIRGLESYEEMVQYHVQGLMHPDVVKIEDKILLKKLAEDLKIPATEMYYGAHKDEWDIQAFKNTLGVLCLKGIDSFIIKAVHLAWSKGQKIVRNWQKDCEQKATTNAAIDELADFVDKEIMNQLASPADKHLREYVTPGVTMEALFKTGGMSKRPLEAKVQTLWGKVHHIFFVGQDPRGCTSYIGAWQYNRDKTGWDFNGMLGGPEERDEISELVLTQAFDELVTHSETFATAVGADVMRVDFFIGFNDDNSVDYKLNEAESVSGARYYHERDGLARAWVDGYVNSGRLKMTPAKWNQIYQETEDARAANQLD